jgi:hypothetical protein
MTFQARAGNKRGISFAAAPPTGAASPHRDCGSGPIHLLPNR